MLAFQGLGILPPYKRKKPILAQEPGSTKPGAGATGTSLMEEIVSETGPDVVVAPGLGRGKMKTWLVSR